MFSYSNCNKCHLWISCLPNQGFLGSQLNKIFQLIKTYPVNVFLGRLRFDASFSGRFGFLKISSATFGRRMWSPKNRIGKLIPCQGCENPVLFSTSGLFWILHFDDCTYWLIVAHLLGKDCLDGSLQDHNDQPLVQRRELRFKLWWWDEMTTTCCNKYVWDRKRIRPGASRRASPDQLCLFHFLRDRIGQSKIFSHDYFPPRRTSCR